MHNAGSTDDRDVLLSCHANGVGLQTVNLPRETLATLVIYIDKSPRRVTPFQILFRGVNHNVIYTFGHLQGRATCLCLGRGAWEGAVQEKYLPSSSRMA